MVKAIRKETEPFTINDSQLNRYHKRKRLMNKCEVVIGRGILCQISIELPKDKNFAIIHFGRYIKNFRCSKKVSLSSDIVNGTETVENIIKLFATDNNFNKLNDLLNKTVNNGQIVMIKQCLKIFEK